MQATESLNKNKNRKKTEQKDAISKDTTKIYKPKKITTDYTPKQLETFWIYKKNALAFLDNPINPPINHAVQIEIRGPLPNKPCERLYRSIFMAITKI